MDTHSVVANAQLIDSIQLLNSVNSFYNQAWSVLLIYIGIGATVVGFIVPVIIQYYQRQFYRAEEKKIKDVLIVEIKTELEEKFKQEKEKLELNLTKHKEGIKKELAGVTAIIFHAQAVQEANRGDFPSATDSVLVAVSNYIKTDDGKNFKRALVNLKTYLPELTPTDIDMLKREGHDFNEIIEEISKNDNKGYFFDLLNDIKVGLSQVRAKKVK